MLPLTVYGSRTCEDTALVRDHLRALGISFESRDREADPAIGSIIERWNKGHIITPTLVFGDDQIVLAEPKLEQLEEALVSAGYRFQPNQAKELHGLNQMPAPDFRLPSSEERQFQLGRLRGRSKSFLFFAHGADCPVCQGYARQLAARRQDWEENETQPVFIVQDTFLHAREWAREFAGHYPALADEGGKIKARYADYFSADPNGVILLVLDQYTAPRAGSFAPDAGGLIIPQEVVAWVALLAAECPE